MSHNACSILMVAEKPSICTSVAEALFAMYNRTRGGGNDGLQARGRSPPVYEFHGMFQGKPSFIRVTSVTGHVFSLDFPAKYQNWDSVDPVDLFSAPTVHSTEGRGGGIARHLQQEAKGMDALVLWMDCDREGENICFEVIQVISGTMKMKFNHAVSSTVPSNVYRAKFSAVTPKDIEHAMQGLVSPNENEALSVDARQELDLKVGVAFSRFQTKYFQGKYGNLDSTVISYGPCQTPTLGFCVQRHDEIKSFVPEPFWSVDLTVSCGTSNRGVPLQWDRKRVFDQDIAEMFSSMLSQQEQLYCYDVKVTEKRRPRPLPLNTVEMLKMASKYLGIGPHATMRAAEHLYLSGYLSYPRTESTSYPKSFDFRDALAIQQDHPVWGQHARELLRDGFTTPRQGHDAGDHPPITPVGLARDLSGDNQRIYELVSRHFLATIYRDAIFQQTKAKFRTISLLSGTEEGFTVTGRRDIDLGFMRVLMDAPSSAEGGEGEEDEDEDLPTCVGDIPDFRKGESYRVSSARLRSGHTSAPGNLTECELIGLMEKNGIGTDASIPTHINNILTRNYVTLGPNRTLQPTDLGVVLVHGYLRIDPDLVLPEVRSAIESFCDLIAKGAAKKEQVSTLKFQFALPLINASILPCFRWCLTHWPTL
jgi:DNA topoisomerase III